MGMRLCNTTSSFAIINLSLRSSPALKCVVLPHIILHVQQMGTLLSSQWSRVLKVDSAMSTSIQSLILASVTTQFFVILVYCESTKQYYDGKECHAMDIGYSLLECLHILGDPGIVFVKVITTSMALIKFSLQLLKLLVKN